MKSLIFLFIAQLHLLQSDVHVYCNGKDYMKLELHKKKTFVFTWKESYHKEYDVFMIGDYVEGTETVTLRVTHQGPSLQTLEPLPKSNEIVLYKKKKKLFLNSIENGLKLTRCR